MFIGALPGILISALSYALLSLMPLANRVSQISEWDIFNEVLDLGKIILLSRHSDGASNDQPVYSLGVKNEV